MLNMVLRGTMYIIEYLFSLENIYTFKWGVIILQTCIIFDVQIIKQIIRQILQVKKDYTIETNIKYNVRIMIVHETPD